MNFLKRHFYNNTHYFLDKKKKRVFLEKSFHQKLLKKQLFGRMGFKKIGGSLVGSILEVNDFNSPFSAFCKLSYIGLPILDRKYVDAGVAIEPLVVKKIEKQLGTKIERFDALKYQYDYFKNVHDIFGGLPDGFFSNAKKISEKNVVIEIKTAGEKKLEFWKKYGIPREYLKQTQLYCYLMKLKKYAIIATFLHEEDYTHPNKYPINERITKMWMKTLNKKEVEDDMKFLSDWYLKHTKSGVSPKFNEKIDSDLIKYLECTNDQEWINLQKNE